MYSFIYRMTIMKYYKQIWIISFNIVSILLLSFGFCRVRINPIQDTFDWDSTPTIDNEQIEKINEWSETINKWSKRFSDKLSGIIKLPQKDDYPTTLWYVTTLIQIAINWLLWILATVVLIYMLYCGFLVLSSWSDDKNVSKGKKWISNAVITIAGIGLSRLIISAMIWFINIISKTNI